MPYVFLFLATFCLSSAAISNTPFHVYEVPDDSDDTRAVVLDSQKLTSFMVLEPESKGEYYRVRVHSRESSDRIEKMGDYWVKKTTLQALKDHAIQGPLLNDGSPSGYVFVPGLINRDNPNETIAVQDKDTGKEFKIPVTAVRLVDLNDQNAWKGVRIHAPAYGQNLYTASINLSKLEGDVIFEGRKSPEVTVNTQEDIKDDVEHVEVKAHSGPQLEWPPKVRDMMEGKSNGNMSNSEGDGNIDKRATARLVKWNADKKENVWSVVETCQQFNKEICEGFKKNGIKNPTLQEFSTIKAIVFQESHYDPISFRKELKYVSRPPQWMKASYRQFLKESKLSDTESRKTNFMASYGLMHVYVPSLMNYPGAIEVQKRPQRLMGAAENLEWGIRHYLWGRDHLKNKKISRFGLNPMDADLVGAAAYNGGIGGAGSGAAGLGNTTVSFHSGIHPEKWRGKRLPYFVHIYHVRKAYENSCRYPQRPCAGEKK